MEILTTLYEFSLLSGNVAGLVFSNSLLLAKVQKTIYQKCVIAIFLDELQDADFFPLVDVFLANNSSEVEVDILHESPCVLNQDCLVSLMRAISVRLRVVDLPDVAFTEDALSEIASSRVYDGTVSGGSTKYFRTELPTVAGRDTFNMSRKNEVTRNLDRSDDSLTNFDMQRVTEEVEDTSHCQKIGSLELSSNALPVLHQQANLQIEVAFGELHVQGNYEARESTIKWNSADALITSKQYISHHPSPICFEKHYREFMIALLPRLEVLDNMPIGNLDRETALTVFSRHYEFLPYKRQYKESVVSVLQMRETGMSTMHRQKSSRLKQPSSHGKSQYIYSRSLCAAKFGSTAWPLLNPISDVGHISKERGQSLRPRQFEYHPGNSCLMAYGTLDGEVVVINHEKGNIVGYIPSSGAHNSILGLCWLKRYPSKLLAGSDNGSLRLYDINHALPRGGNNSCHSSSTVTFDDFEHLTSVHVNSADDQILTSGYSKKVAVYDICSGKRLQLFTDMHREPINVAKFSNHSPSILVTSSFDHNVKMWDLRQKPVQPCYSASSSRGNVMVCFSPDDLYLLVSAVDNEVKQLLAVDGRLQTDFEIASTGSAHNYTRSYYINGRDYIISGSCDEPVIRICCAQTGRRLKDVYLEGKDSRGLMYVQSLRGDPFRDFHMAVLAANSRPSPKWEIIKVYSIVCSFFMLLLYDSSDG
ncbi:hypothetical protein RJ639_034940 [Escallonia herrerae]|uniref:U2A'/phosphoprotein 32 family A C-terminal domain-containing protein n=1 Tax=Escallonia herrerae TaxID=1293975 RepID=A0AA88WS45_9ASTE|nr:hypothetical protein RJ639_034940 [Escallonia herrerae]